MPVRHSLFENAGEVSVDRERCNRCGLCVEVCPAEVLTLDEGVRQISNDFDCIACGHCMMVCPQECIRVVGRDLAPEDLMPLPAAEERAGAEALEALMRSRRSVRRFSDRPVAPELIERILSMAATAPMGIPPWDVGVARVCGAAEVQRLSGEVVAGYRGMLKVFGPRVLALLRPFLGRARFERFSRFILPLAEAYVRYHGQGRDAVFWGAPAVLVFHHSPYADATDAAIACTYAMLAAESLGLGSCMIGGAPPILQRNRALCRRLGIPDGNKPSIALILGYSAVSFRRTVRRRFTPPAPIP